MNESSSLVADGLDFEPAGFDMLERCRVAVLVAGGRGEAGREEEGLRGAEDLGADGEAGCVGVLPLSALFARYTSRSGTNQL